MRRMAAVTCGQTGATSVSRCTQNKMKLELKLHLTGAANNLPIVLLVEGEVESIRLQ